MKKQAAAAVEPVRQRTQYTCMATSLSMCLKANGLDYDEDTVNKVMGARPMQGASWEQAFAAAQHFGQRVTMVIPATLNQVKAWTDKGVPVMIAWNPEGRPWSHASVIFDVTDDGLVHIADPNIPDPDQTVRIVPKDEFYKKWYEQWPDYLVRRPALAIEREVSPDGKQRVASTKAMRQIEREFTPVTPRRASVGRASSGASLIDVQIEALENLLLRKPKEKLVLSVLAQLKKGKALTEYQAGPLFRMLKPHGLEEYEYAFSSAARDPRVDFKAQSGHGTGKKPSLDEDGYYSEAVLASYLDVPLKRIKEILREAAISGGIGLRLGPKDRGEYRLRDVREALRGSRASSLASRWLSRQKDR